MTAISPLRDDGTNLKGAGNGWYTASRRNAKLLRGAFLLSEKKTNHSVLDMALYIVVKSLAQWKLS